MTLTQRAYVQLHIAVFLWGFTAILGDTIQLPALVLVWWRVLLTSLSMLFFIRVGQVLRQLPLKSILQFALVGTITGLHWLTFFGAVKLSNASVTLVCMSTGALFTSLLEPLLLRQRLKWLEVLLGLLVVPGMVLVTGSLDASMYDGMLVGLSSAVLMAIFNVLNKKWILNAEPFSITFIEMSSACITLGLVLAGYALLEPGLVFWPSPADWVQLLALALLCTTLTWFLALRALKHLTAFASTLTVNLEPVYGIFLAWVLLNENRELSAGFYGGVLLILSAVFSYPFLKKRFGKAASAA
jgi:drug/metabolite transporter (DMT)-like permease